MALKMPTQQSYIPRNPSKAQNHINSTLQVLRTSDGASFLATALPTTVVKDTKKNTTYTTGLVDAILPTAAHPLSQLLNHPNIISLIDLVRNTNVPGDISTPNKWADISIWEDMDAGCLAYLLPLSNSYPAAGDHKSWAVLSAENTHRFGLPEGLVWHVLRSVSRSLAWLHHGKKEERDIPGHWKPGDPDWQPVLIMDISPGQIWFQHPVGRETYGSCKIGGFSHARVAGSQSVAQVPRDENLLGQKRWFVAPEVKENIHKHSRQSEVWSLGATLYCMMTGIPPVGEEEGRSMVWNLSRLNDRGYSAGLREMVAAMLRENPVNRIRVGELISKGEHPWEVWRATEEGSRHVDVGDAVRERCAKGGRVRGPMDPSEWDA